jgi:hypothetical protein
MSNIKLYANRINLREIELLRFIPKQIADDIQTKIDNILNNLKFSLENKKFVTESLSEFGYFMYKKSAIVTKDQMLLFCTPNSKSVIQKSDDEQEAYLKETCVRFLNTCDEGAYLSSYFETIPESLDINKFFFGLDQKLATNSLITKEWKETATKIRNSLLQDLNNNNYQVNKTNAYFVLSLPIKNYNLEEYLKTYQTLFETFIRFENQIKVKHLKDQDLENFITNHFINISSKMTDKFNFQY